MQSVLKQQLNSDHYNMCSKVPKVCISSSPAVSVWCLLSVRHLFSFFFLIRANQNASTYQICSFCNFTNSVTWFSLATCCVHHLNICLSQQSVKNDRQTWADDKSSFNLPLLHFFCLKPSCVHDDIRTVSLQEYRKIEHTLPPQLVGT